MTDKVRIIFLDFDGVLHAVSGARESMREFVWLPILKDLIKDYTDVRIVVHSSARFVMSPEFIMERMELTDKLFMGVTDKGMEREKSILSWIEKNKDKITSYVVLDDSGREFVKMKKDLILCDSKKGISEEYVKDLLEDWLRFGSFSI